MDLQWENMQAGIESQLPLVRSGASAAYRSIQRRLGRAPLPSQIFLVGCGDSWYCGLSTRLAFEAWSGLRTEALQAMEFSRYVVDYAPKDSLVIATSNSGRVSRTIECVKKANDRGLTTIGLTSNRDSSLASEAKVVIDLDYPERRFAPGTSSYTASLLTLYALALQWAKLGGHLSEREAQSQLDRISSLAGAMQETLTALDQPIRQLAQKVGREAKISFLGAGPNYGTALFAMAKMIEAAQHNAIGQELEEWAHEQYFVTGPDTYTFVFAPEGAGLDRAREQLLAIRDMQSYAIAICEMEDVETQNLADLCLPVFGCPDEVLSPLIYCLAPELFALRFAQAKDRTMLGFDDPRRKSVNFRQIFESKISS